MNKFWILFCIFIFTLPGRSVGINSDFQLMGENEEINISNTIIPEDPFIPLESFSFFFENTVLQSPSPGDGSSGGNDSGGGDYVNSRDATNKDAFTFLISLTLIYGIYLQKSTRMKNKS